MSTDGYFHFRTPWGIYPTREEAHDECVRRKVDPLTHIQAEAYPTDVVLETAYGSTYRMSQPVRVF